MAWLMGNHESRQGYKDILDLKSREFRGTETEGELYVFYNFVPFCKVHKHLIFVCSNSLFDFNDMFYKSLKQQQKMVCFAMINR